MRRVSLSSVAVPSQCLNDARADFEKRVRGCLRQTSAAGRFRWTRAATVLVGVIPVLGSLPLCLDGAGPRQLAPQSFGTPLDRV